MGNAVTGATKGGPLFLSQNAHGGAGGSSSGGIGGAGGAATSSLVFDDTKSVTQSALVSSESIAIAGAGGAGASGRAGGQATASQTIIGSGGVHAFSTATGGDGGAPGAVGGNAAASTVARAATDVDGEAHAHGGFGFTTAGTALANTSAFGASGTFAADADTGLTPGQLIQFVATTTSGVVDGASTAQALAKIGGLAANFSTAYQGIASETGAPAAFSVNAVLAANPAIKMAFGSTPSFFSLGELGGGHARAGTDVETTTSSLEVKVDLNQLSDRQDLLVGLYHPFASGKGVTQVTLDISANGSDLFHEAFSSASAAVAFFSDHPLDLGSLAHGGIIGQGDLLDLKVTLGVTSNSAGSAFDAGFLIGDPPPGLAPPGLSVVAPMSHPASFI
jgi:hypothetical protein